MKISVHTKIDGKCEKFKVFEGFTKPHVDDYIVLDKVIYQTKKVVVDYDEEAVRVFVERAE